MVLFSKGKSLVMNESRKKLISGVRTFDNCYELVPDAESREIERNELEIVRIL